MDQTEKIAHQFNQHPAQNNPESQKDSSKLSNNGGKSQGGQQSLEKPQSQNYSQSQSRPLSQTASQMDQKIMRGLSKKQKRRYTTFLEALGIDVEGKLDKTQNNAIQDGQNLDHQQFEPLSVPIQIRHPDEPYEETHHLESQPGHVETLFNQGQFSLVENESQKAKHQRELSEKSNSINPDIEIKNQMQTLEKQPDTIYECPSQALPSNQTPNFNIEHMTQEQKSKSQPKPQAQSYEDIDIDGSSHYPHTNIKAETHYQLSDGEMSMEVNYDPCSHNKPFTDFSYDMINSIYTPVSHVKFSLEQSKQISIDNNFNVQSTSNQLVTVMEQLKEMVQGQNVETNRIYEQKDVEIDGPTANYQVHEELRIEADQNCKIQQVNSYKDVDIDAPSAIFSVQDEKNEKQIQIDLPLIPHEATSNLDVEIDGPLHIQELPLVPQQNSQFQEAIVKLQMFDQNSNEPHKPYSEITPQQISSQKSQNTQNFDNVQKRITNQTHKRELRPNNFIVFNPSAKIFKTQSQSNETPNSGIPKQKKPSQTSSFHNRPHFNNLEENTNRRKFSECSRSPALNSVSNKVSSNKRLSQQIKGKNPSFALSQNIFDSRELNSFQEQDQNMLEIEEQFEPQDSVKITPNGNSFSNRSEKSSIKSKRSNRFSDEMVNEKQVQPLDGLQLVRDGKEARLQRKSRSSQNSNGSRNSRSASTCRKSYDDLSEIKMEKIDENGEEMEQKSVKKTRSRIFVPVHQAENQSIQIDNQIFSLNPNQKTQEEVEIDGKNVFIEQICQPLEQKKVSQKKDNFFQIFSHQIIIQLDKESQIQPDFEQKSIQYSVVSQPSSPKTTVSQQLRQKVRNFTFVPALNIQIENALPIEQRLDHVLIICKEYLSESRHSNYERSKFKEILKKHFEFFGTELQPITDLGQRMLHDGIFACSYITFIKEVRNSGMLESLMFTQFQQEVGIRTSKQIFLVELKRVKEEREMHYNSEFEKRLKEYQQRKAKEQARKQTQVRQVPVLIEKKQPEKTEKNRPKLQISKVWSDQYFLEVSNDSQMPSSETMTIDEGTDWPISPIKKARIQDIQPKSSKPLIKETDSVFDSSELDQSQIRRIEQQREIQAKKLIQAKKRVTKKKEKKKDLQVQPALVKTQFSEESGQETISQVQQKVQSQRKIAEDTAASIQTQSLGQKQKNTKGIRKVSKPARESQQVKQKKQKRSPSKKEIPKVSRKKKLEVLVSQESETSNTKAEKSRNKRKKMSSDDQGNDLSATISPRNKVSIQKAVQSKVNQGKVVKFLGLTKGGDTNSNQKRINHNLFAPLPEEQSQEEQGPKMTLRSRSKK